MEQDAQQWHTRMENLMAQDAQIITFRGAGTVNGIDLAAAALVTHSLRYYVTKITQEGSPVALVYDGDEDNRDRPDIGSVFGGLVDALRDNPAVTALAAQSQGWYSPKRANGALESASGTPYETYVFPDDLPGSHAALTQSEALVAYAGYEQIFVGPAGPIALNQLKDLSDKTVHRSAEQDPVAVSVLQLPNNPNINRELAAQLAAATDEQEREKIIAKMVRRQAQPYGEIGRAHV